MQRKFFPGIYLVLVFVSGTVLGAFANRLYMVNTVLSSNPTPGQRMSPDEYRKQYVNELRTRLNLDGDQKVKLDAILDDTRQRMHEIHERTRPEMKAIQDDQYQKVRALLNPQQQTEYEKMRQERDRKRKEGK